MRSLLTLLLLAGPVSAAGRTFEVTYPPSEKPGELVYGVTFTVWVPDGVKTLRGVVVHQHGCGAPACKGGATAAFDLHWQALAKKHECALLGPSYQQPDGADCRKWCDPRNGSRAAFLKALDELAKKSDHPELARVPWCLWGHSGGGFWSSLMLASDPERVVAVWCRSGTALAAWEALPAPIPDLSAVVYRVPVALNPGAKEKGDKRFDGAFTGSVRMFDRFRVKGAPVLLAPDPRTSHECGDSRYLAIPFFDACLAQRLPAAGETALKPIDATAAVEAPFPDAVAKLVGETKGTNWLPNKAVAAAWTKYVTTGAVSDSTPPPAPLWVKAVPADGAVELTWDAEADFESGLLGFVIERDGALIATLPEKPVGKFGRPLFQVMSYHDTPEAPLPAMRFMDKAVPAGAKPAYRVIAVNSVGLKSEPTSAK